MQVKNILIITYTCVPDDVLMIVLTPPGVPAALIAWPLAVTNFPGAVCTTSIIWVFPVSTKLLMTNDMKLMTWLTQTNWPTIDKHPTKSNHKKTDIASFAAIISTPYTTPIPTPPSPIIDTMMPPINASLHVIISLTMHSIHSFMRVRPRAAFYEMDSSDHHHLYRRHINIHSILPRA